MTDDYSFGLLSIDLGPNDNYNLDLLFSNSEPSDPIIPQSIELQHSFFASAFPSSLIGQSLKSQDISSLIPYHDALLQSQSVSQDLNARIAPLADLGRPANTRKRKAPTLRAEDWEPHKARIIELHIHNAKPLPEVKDIMEKETGFKAEYVFAPW